MPADRTMLSDEALIAVILHGDVNAFEELVKRYERLVFVVVSCHVPSDRVAETAHEVFVQAYRALSSFAGRSEFKRWLTAIAARKCCDFWRSARRQPAVFSSLSEDAGQWLDRHCRGQSLADFVSKQDQQYAREIVARLLDRVSAEDRMVMSLMYLEDRSVREIADLLGWSVVNVKVRAFRARQALKRAWQKMQRQEGSGS